MRTLDTGQTRVYEAPGRSTHLKVSVKLSSTWYNLADLDGFDFLDSVEIEDNIDNPTMTARVVTKRRYGLLSIWPEDENSKYNNLTGSYSPLLQSQREIKIETAVMPSGVDPIDTDWQNVFEGKIGPIDSGNGKITLNCTDLGGDLLRNFIETQRVYGDPSGTSIEGEMQQILTDNSTGVTLYTPTSPSWNVKEWIQQKEPVLTALRRLAQQIGWDIKYRWDSGTSAWRLTLYEPDRSKSTPDHTFLADDNFVWSKMPSINDDSVRNKIRVIYTDAVGENPAEKEVSDATSIALYGTRFMEIQEDSSSNIDTVTEATDMANAILADLKDPILNATIETGYFWAAETGDLYRFPADDINWTSDKDLAVQGFVHHFPNKGMPTTSFTLQGKVTGYVKIWLQKQAAPGLGKTYDKLGPRQKWRVTRHSSRAGIGSFHKSVESSERGMLQNCDFGYQSRVKTGSGWPPDNWYVVTGVWGPSGDLYLDETVSESGSRSLLYTSSGGATAEVETDYIPVEDPNSLGIVARAKTDSTSGSNHVQILIDQYDISKSFISSLPSVAYTFTGTAWTDTNVGINLLGATTRYVKIRLYLTHAAGQKIWIDNVFCKVVADQAFLYNDTANPIFAANAWTSVTYDSTKYSYYGAQSSPNLVEKKRGTYLITSTVGMSSAVGAAGSTTRLKIQSSPDAAVWTDRAFVSGIFDALGDSSLQASYISTPDDSELYFRAQVWHNYTGAAVRGIPGEEYTHFWYSEVESF